MWYLSPGSCTGCWPRVLRYSKENPNLVVLRCAVLPEGCFQPSVLSATEVVAVCMRCAPVTCVGVCHPVPAWVPAAFPLQSPPRELLGVTELSARLAPLSLVAVSHARGTAALHQGISQPSIHNNISAVHDIRM